MPKRVVFAFDAGFFPLDPIGHLNLFFHADGLFRREEDIADSSRALCPIDALDWRVPELAVMTVSLPSILMRFIMHPSIVGQYAPPGCLVSATSDHAAIRDSVVIVHKTLVLNGNADILLALRKRNNILLLDLLDYTLPRTEEIFPLLDGLIVCSHKAYEHYANLSGMMPPLFYVTHCIDVRLPERVDAIDRFSPLYHGAPENMLFYPSLQKILPTAFCYVHQTPQEEWLARTLRANFFYALRPRTASFQMKPFQKGFTAARLDANILIHRDDGDALHFLGEEYPYMIHEEPTEEFVWRYMKMAEKDFGGSRWDKGLAIMRSLRPYYARETIAGEFWDMIRRIS